MLLTVLVLPQKKLSTPKTLNFGSTIIPRPLPDPHPRHRRKRSRVCALKSSLLKRVGALLDIRTTLSFSQVLGGATGPTPPSTTTLPRSEAETEAAATVLEELALQHTSGPSSAKLELPPCPFPSPLGSLYPTIVATYPRPMSNLDNIILNGLLDMLPSNDVLERLIPRYMDHPAFGMHILCFPQFKQVGWHTLVSDRCIC